jgi:hypothetical protein
MLTLYDTVGRVKAGILGWRARFYQIVRGRLKHPTDVLVFVCRA